MSELTTAISEIIEFFKRRDPGRDYADLLPLVDRATLAAMAVHQQPPVRVASEMEGNMAGGRFYPVAVQVRSVTGSTMEEIPLPLSSPLNECDREQIRSAMRVLNGWLPAAMRDLPARPRKPSKGDELHVDAGIAYYGEKDMGIRGQPVKMLAVLVNAPRHAATYADLLSSIKPGAISRTVSRFREAPLAIAEARKVINAAFRKLQAPWELKAVTSTGLRLKHLNARRKV